MAKREQPNSPSLAERLSLIREVARLRGSEQLLREQNEELTEGQALLEDVRDDFAELYDWAPLPLLTLGAQGTVRSANLATAELFQRERSWILGRAFRMLFHEVDRPRLARCLNAVGGVRQCTAQLILPDEGLVEVLLSRRVSLRKTGVSHISLVDLRTGRGAVPAPANDARQARARLRILVIEDHLETAETMQEVLEHHGYAVVAADSVGAAADVDLTRVDAILSDIVLPDGMGTDLLRQLKRARNVPAIAFSGLTKSSDIESAMQAGFDLFLSKPVDFPHLLTALGALLGPATPKVTSQPV